MGQISKKDLYKKIKKNKDASHWEGKWFCDCRVRNIRKWLAAKRGLTKDLDDRLY